MAPPRHRRPSSVDRLDPEIKELIGKLRIDHGWTIDEIRAKLLKLGQGDVPSRSAIGRHIKSIEELGAQLRQSRVVANALIANIGDAPEDRTADLNTEIMHTLILRLVTATDDDGDGQPITFEPKDVKFLTGALKDLAGAKKTNADMVLKVRQEAAKEAAKRVETAATAKGLDKSTVAFITNAVLGVES